MSGDDDSTGGDQATGLIPQWGSSTDMFKLSKTLIQSADDLVKKLTNESWFQPITIGANFPGIGAAPTPLTVKPPTLDEVIWTTPTAPADFSIKPPDPAGLFPRPFDDDAPVLNFGTPPSSFSGTAPSSPIVNLNFTYPTIDNIDIPTPPELLSLSIVNFDPFTIPVFDAAVPTLNLSPPNIIPFSEQFTYTSTLLSTVQDEIVSALLNDTDIGLSASTQQAMWDAARERELRAQADALAELDRMEALGYAFPPGVFIDGRLKIQTETNYTLAGLSRDIMVKQAELRLENVTKSRELAVTLEGQLIGYANNVQQRLFETAKYETEASISIYNAQVQLYGARVEAFKGLISAYEAQIEGIKANIEQKKAQVEYEQAKAEINKLLVDTYKAEIDAQIATLEVAKTQVAIIQTEASVEKTKVDIYSAQIQAFVATINAYTAEVEGYKANVEAQGTIENVYKTQVEAYTARVQAGSAQYGAMVEGYKAQVQAYSAKLEGYKASLTAMVEQAHAQFEFNSDLVQAYTARVNATTEYNKAVIAEWQAIINEQIQVTEAVIKEAEANAQITISQRQFAVDALKAAAQVMAQLGAAALGAIHWSNTSNWSLSDSISASVTTQTSTSENHNFNESA